MKGNGRKHLSSMVQSAVILFIGGVALFILLLAGSFGAFPIYITEALLIAGGHSAYWLWF